MRHRHCYAGSLSILATALLLSCASSGSMEQALTRTLVLPQADHTGIPVVEAGSIEPGQVLPVDPQVRVGILPNGLRYYIRENGRPENRAELRLVMNTGSIMEDTDQRGLAHFIEHMAFNGSEHFEKQELLDFLESIGMTFGPDLNAMTSFDETIFMLTVPTDSTEDFEQSFLVLEDWAHGLSFDPEELDKERGVIIEEWRGGRGAQMRMLDIQLPILFHNSLYAERLPIGDMDVIRSFDRETILRYYEEWYRPDLMAVVAVGDFDAERVEELIHYHFTDLVTETSNRPRTYAEVPDHEETLFAIATDPEATGTGVQIYWKLPLRATGTAADYRQSMVERIYDSMLNRRLAELTQQADPPFLGASASKGLFIRSKEVYSLGAAVENDGIVRGLEAAFTEVERVARHGFLSSELERQKVILLRSIEQAYRERDKLYSSSYAGEYVNAFLYGEVIPGLEYEYELYQRFIPEITLEEVNALARAWITDRNRVIMISAPEKEDVVVPSEDELLDIFIRVAGLEIAPYEENVADIPLMPEDPVPGVITAERSIDEIDITEWELSNGVRVIIKPTDFDEDRIVFQAFSPGGVSLSSDEEYYSASLAAPIIASGGIGSFNAIDLGKKLAGKVVSVTPTISSLEEGFSGSASPEDLETLFQLVNLYFSEPRRDEEVFESMMTMFRSMIPNLSASPESAFTDTLTVTLTQNHPRHQPVSLELIEQIDLDTCYRFFRDRFADAGDFTFVFVGNIDLESFRPLVERYLGSLPTSGREESWRDEGVDYPTGVITKTVHKGLEQKSQTAIIFTGRYEYGRQSLYALRSLTQVMDIILRERLREDLGGTYGVSVNYDASYIPDEEYGVTISFGTDPERLEELSGVVFEELQKLRTEGPTAEYIEKVRESQRSDREESLRQNSYWLGQLGSRYRLDSDPREILTYETLIDALTPEMVREAAVKFLDFENYIQISLMPEGGGT
ncbi:M16 family metallopeptidase [Candidatus Zixiibacteriota bacterium]